jgi:hypothetical protein
VYEYQITAQETPEPPQEPGSGGGGESGIAAIGAGWTEADGGSDSLRPGVLFVDSPETENALEMNRKKQGERRVSNFECRDPFCPFPDK